MKCFDPTAMMKNFHLRSTRIRHSLIHTLYQNKGPISASIILDQLKNNFNMAINKTTLYRQLDCLTQKEIISVLEVGGIQHFQFNHSHSHQYLFCQSCHKFIPLNSKDFITPGHTKNIEKNNHFIINHYSTLYFGKCQQCQPKNSTIKK